MSSKEVKKPASRDISDLKARLGLKKDGVAGGRAATPAPPGAVPPPGAARGGAVPPPPGAAPPQPQIPDARNDPFAAMNAMAQTQAQPQQVAAPVFIDDGKPVESVQKTSTLGKLKWVGLIFAPLLLGFLIGGVSYKNQAYNQAITHAGMLTEELSSIRTSLTNLNDALLEAKTRGPGGKSFAPGDQKLTETLASLKLQKPDRNKLFHSNLSDMGVELAEDTLVFYSDLYTLYDEIDRHIRLSESDAKKDAQDSPALKKLGSSRLAIRFLMPSGNRKGPPAAEIVELGAPICSDRKPHPEGCGDSQPMGFEFRPDPTDTRWGQLGWSPDQVTTDGVVFLAPNPVFNILMAGSERFYDDVAYMQRISSIEAKTNALLAARKTLEDRLNAKAQESKRFSL